MIAHESLIKALRTLNFKFKRQADRVELYKQSGTTKRVELRRHDLHEDDYARVVLRQAGMPVDEIEQFITEARTGRH